jgi:phytoene dehydrogenase-like protein
MEHYTLNPKGAVYGWANTVDQTAFNRLPQETPIQNLFLAGAWTQPGPGQSQVMLSGLNAAEKILESDSD